jgi:hypothetical protein
MFINKSEKIKFSGSYKFWIIKIICEPNIKHEKIKKSLLNSWEASKTDSPRTKNSNTSYYLRAWSCNSQNYGTILK